ncbi:MAG TPA: proline dehydrogenase family protein [Actinomycetota bacterium]|nr:proline dehydrogenase family protein [Actinomycetota bacterium]
MTLLRNAVLWAAENRWLRTHLPRYRFVRASVRRFMPGESLDEAMTAASDLEAQGLVTAFTQLGENVTTVNEARAVFDHYLAAFDAIVERGLHAELSVKPTHLGLDVDRAMAAEHLDALARRADERGTWLWLDMESSRYVEATVDLYRGVRTAHPNTGICLQAYLRRTADDIESLLPLEPSVRLVKGAYREPDALLVGGRASIDESYRSLGLRLLERGGAASRVVLGTHDVDLAKQVERDAAVRGMGRDAFEIEMLYGIRATDQVRLAAEGYRVRTLIAYGSYWYPWFMRRIAERPIQNSLLALRNLVAR